MSDISQLEQKLSGLLRRPNSRSNTLSHRIADEVVIAARHHLHDDMGQSLITGLRELAARGLCNNRQVEALVQFSLELDGKSGVDESLKSLSVLGMRSEYLSSCCLMVERASIEVPSGRWIAFYAASMLLRAQRPDLLTHDYLRILQHALEREDAKSPARKKFALTLTLLREKSSSELRRNSQGASEVNRPKLPMDDTFRPVGTEQMVASAL